MNIFYKKNLKKVFVGVFLTIITTTYAHAVDKNDFVKRLQSTPAMEAFSLNFQDVESVGNDITLHGSVISYKEPKIAEELGEIALGDLVFENVTEDTDGNYLIGRLKIDEIKKDLEVEKDFEVFNFQLNNLAFENFVLFSEQNSSDIKAMLMTGTVLLDSFTVSVNNKLFLSLKNFKQSNVLKDNHVLDMTSNLDSFAYYTNNEASQTFSDVLKVIRPGKDSLDGSFNVHATWDVNSGDVDLEKMEIILNDLGKINFNLIYGGFTADFAKAYQQINNDLQSKILSEDFNKADMQAYQKSFYDLIGQIVIKYVALRFDNEDLMQNILASLVAKSGLTKEQLIEQAKASLPLIAIYVPNEKFVKNAIEQLSLFLDNPKSLTIATTKGRESKISQIVQAVSTNPTAFLDILGVTITANQ